MRDLIETKKFHKRYHGPDKGCVTVLKKRVMLQNKHYIEIYYCPKHNKETSRGGWEWGWYSGTANNPQTQAVERLEKLYHTK